MTVEMYVMNGYGMAVVFEQARPSAVRAVSCKLEPRIVNTVLGSLKISFGGREGGLLVSAEIFYVKNSLVSE